MAGRETAPVLTPRTRDFAAAMKNRAVRRASRIIRAGRGARERPHGREAGAPELEKDVTAGAEVRATRAKEHEQRLEAGKSEERIVPRILQTASPADILILGGPTSRNVKS